MLSYLFYLNKLCYNAPFSPTHDMKFVYSYSTYTNTYSHLHISTYMYTTTQFNQTQAIVPSFFKASVISSGGLRA